MPPCSPRGGGSFTKLISALEKKLSRILFDEWRHPNKYEQHITSIYSHFFSMMEQDSTDNGGST